MNVNFKYLLLVSFLLSSVSWAKDFYVAPNGNDKNPGALSSPFASILAAQSAASSGDTVYLRGGTYSLNNENITSTDSVRAYVNTIAKNGISYIAYPEEQPIFDYNNVKPADLRVVAFFVSGDNNVFEGFEVVGVQVTIDYKRTQSTAFRVDGGDYNRFEHLSIHDGMAIGWFLQSGSYNQVINVDVYNNKGFNHYSHGNVDGFGIHAKSATGVGNIIKGCRAWFNSDDGFDFINSNAAATVENSWAMYNGYDTDFTRMADGHGFKAGGYGRNGKVDYPVPVPRHVVKNCLAVGNKASGFYANHHTGGIDWIHNTAIKNPHNYNMLSTDVETNAQDIPGFDHYMRNNLGYGATSTEVANLGSSKTND
ncbi:MAG: hypothetical protein JKY14_01065, partial [Paraglaciecola sp.]|nr:hypothetical protein [Paraglaciecola sp.]